MIQNVLKPASLNAGATGQATLVAVGESTGVAVPVSGVPKKKG